MCCHGNHARQINLFKAIYSYTKCIFLFRISVSVYTVFLSALVHTGDSKHDQLSAHVETFCASNCCRMREIISTALDWSCKIIVWSTTKFIPQHLLYFRARCCSLYDGLSDRSFMVDPLSYFSKTTKIITNKQTNKQKPKKTPKTTTYKSNLVKQCSKFHSTRVYRVLRCLKLGQKGVLKRFVHALPMLWSCDWQ